MTANNNHTARVAHTISRGIPEGDGLPSTHTDLSGCLDRKATTGVPGSAPHPFTAKPPTAAIAVSAMCACVLAATVTALNAIGISTAGIAVALIGLALWCAALAIPAAVRHRRQCSETDGLDPVEQQAVAGATQRPSTGFVDAHDQDHGEAPGTTDLWTGGTTNRPGLSCNGSDRTKPQTASTTTATTTVDAVDQIWGRAETRRAEDAGRSPSAGRKDEAPPEAATRTGPLVMGKLPPRTTKGAGHGSSDGRSSW